MMLSVSSSSGRDWALYTAYVAPLPSISTPWILSQSLMPYHHSPVIEPFGLPLSFTVIPGALQVIAAWPAVVELIVKPLRSMVVFGPCAMMQYAPVVVAVRSAVSVYDPVTTPGHAAA